MPCRTPYLPYSSMPSLAKANSSLPLSSFHSPLSLDFFFFKSVKQCSIFFSPIPPGPPLLGPESGLVCVVRELFRGGGVASNRETFSFLSLLLLGGVSYYEREKSNRQI